MRLAATRFSITAGSTGPPEVDFADADWLAQANESARMIVRMRMCRLSEKYDASDFKNGAVFECYLRIQWSVGPGFSRVENDIPGARSARSARPRPALLAAKGGKGTMPYFCRMQEKEDQKRSISH
jgi:hypothetical protein